MAKFLRTTWVSKMSIVLIISYSAFQMVSANDNETALVVPQTTPSKSEVTKKIPVDLYDLGYYDGDWEKFCDRKDIYEEFLYYPEHELKKVRILLCQRILRENNFNNDTLAACALYKYCLLMRPRVDEFIEAFVDKFSMNDTQKKEELVRRDTFDETTSCYKTCEGEFEKKCIAAGNAFHSMFKQIFARACTYAELTTEVIVSTIEEVCHDKFMTDKVNWYPYYATIGLKF